MLLYKTLHIIFMVTWFAGLFYLPRLYVYHAQAEDQISKDRFKIMERKLFWGIMTPGAVLTVLFGVLLIEYHGMSYWLKMKILLVLNRIWKHLYQKGKKLWIHASTLLLAIFYFLLLVWKNRLLSWYWYRQVQRLCKHLNITKFNAEINFGNQQI